MGSCFLLTILERLFEAVMKFTKSTKRAAHFLQVPEIASSPANDAIVNALLELGYEVDLYAPGRHFTINAANRYSDSAGAKLIGWCAMERLACHLHRFRA
jgi:hypothetical protein